jgi:hypothetical protein
MHGFHTTPDHQIIYQQGIKKPFIIKKESRRRDLDPRPADYKSAAPPAKLRRHQRVF